MLRTMFESSHWKLGVALAAREVRSSGLLEAPEVPGDGPDGQIFKFPDFAQNLDPEKKKRFECSGLTTKSADSFTY